VSTRERPREKKKPKKQTATEAVQEPPAAREPTLESERPVTATAVTRPTRPATQVAQAPAVEEAAVVQPSWGGPEDAGWMYLIPPQEQGRKSWSEEWGEFLLEWARAKCVHVVSLGTFITESPFKDIFGKVDAFRLIAESLIEKGTGEWLDRRKKRLRVYWRPLEDWVDVIYEWALRTGQTLIDVKSLMIQETAQEFSTLPEKDLHRIVKMMVDRELAEWVDKKKGAVRIIV